MNMPKLLKTALTTVCMALGLAGAIHAQASVVIAATRVIYNAKDTEETLKLNNVGQSPALVQTWLDNGDANASPSTVDVPFTVTPPIARIDPNKAQTLRIVYTGEALPQDKETAFWLNMLEVPPKASEDEAGKNKLQLAFRSRIKLFYRPANLKGSSDDAPGQVSWHLTRAGNQQVVEAHNPTPYYVSFTGVEVSAGAKTAIFDDGGMVAPGESKTFALKGDVPASAEAILHYHALNDFGGAVNGDVKLNQGASQAGK